MEVSPLYSKIAVGETPPTDTTALWVRPGMGYFIYSSPAAGWVSFEPKTLPPSIFERCYFCQSGATAATRHMAFPTDAEVRVFAASFSRDDASCYVQLSNQNGQGLHLAACIPPQEFVLRPTDQYYYIDVSRGSVQVMFNTAKAQLAESATWTVGAAPVNAYGPDLSACSSYTMTGDVLTEVLRGDFGTIRTVARLLTEFSSRSNTTGVGHEARCEISSDGTTWTEIGFSSNTNHWGRLAIVWRVSESFRFIRWLLRTTSATATGTLSIYNLFIWEA